MIEGNAPLALETRRALCAESMRRPVFLDDLHVHVVGGFCEDAAGLWVLLNEYADPRGRYLYDPVESYRVAWNVVQQVLATTGVFQRDQVERRVRGSGWHATELHMLGIRTAGYGILRFERLLEEATFQRLTRYNGLPHDWIAWHQHMTYDWPCSLEYFPIITRGMWQRLLMQQEPEWDSSYLLPQDPVPLLEQFRDYCQVTKTLRVVPCTLTDANRYVVRYHRHCEPVTGSQYALAATDATGLVRGVVILGRPIARALDVGKAGEMKRRVIEVRRLATDGTPNIPSLLYGAARRLAKEAGYERILTYTLQTESGASLRGAGWQLVAETGGKQWNGSRARRIKAIHDAPKYRWECALNEPFPFEQIAFPAEAAQRFIVR